MKKKLGDDKLTLRIQQQGLVYRLVEQFEEISRIDLAKLSQLAPATITSLTRDLINKKLLIEKAVRNTESRGRPAIGLCVSPFYWQSLCAILSEDRFNLLLCELDGTPIEEKSYPLNLKKNKKLGDTLLKYLQDFLSLTEGKMPHPITFSVAVVGELDDKDNIVRLGQKNIKLNLKSLFKPYFNIPILIKEYFEAWLLWESSLGTVIGYNNVLFLQVDDIINLSILSEGKIFSPNNNIKIDINTLSVPRFSTLQDVIYPALPDVERYQLKNQITYDAIYELIDFTYPNNGLENTPEKFKYLTQKFNDGEQSAIELFNFVADSLAYILMNLVKIFSSQKIMLISGLLQLNTEFVARINKKLTELLIGTPFSAEVLTSRYEWNDPIVISAAIKRGIYDGTLLQNLTRN